jgi:hypothetical protein
MYLHWSHRLSADNPRGYTDRERHRVRHARSSAARQEEELGIVRARLEAEKQRVYPIDDEYGVERLERMEEEVEEEYASGRCSYGPAEDDDEAEAYEDEVTPQPDSDVEIVGEVVGERSDSEETEVEEVEEEQQSDAEDVEDAEAEATAEADARETAGSEYHDRPSSKARVK